MKVSSSRGGGHGDNGHQLHNRLLNAFFLVCWSFNAASFQSIYNGGPMFTAADPLVGSALMAILCLALLLTTPPKKTSNVLEVVHRTLCLLGAVLLLFVSWVHFRNHAFYETHYAYHESHWRYAIIINLFGTASLLAKTLQGMTMKRVILISVSMVLVSSLAAAMYTLTDTDDGAANKAEDVPGHCSDAPFFAAVPSGQAPPSLPVSPVEHFQHSSSYLAMSDGVKLAADVYLPTTMTLLHRNLCQLFCI